MCSLTTYLSRHVCPVLRVHATSEIAPSSAKPLINLNCAIRSHHSDNMRWPILLWCFRVFGKDIRPTICNRNENKSQPPICKIPQIHFNSHGSHIKVIRATRAATNHVKKPCTTREDTKRFALRDSWFRIHNCCQAPSTQCLWPPMTSALHNLLSFLTAVGEWFDNCNVRYSLDPG